MNVLEGINANPYLQERLVLKGGTALNLFVFDLPRLSVDLVKKMLERSSLRIPTRAKSLALFQDKKKEAGWPLYIADDRTRT
jgi:hypothetical protein